MTLILVGSTRFILAEQIKGNFLDSMKPTFSDFIRLKHYGKARVLKTCSYLQLFASLLFIFLPFAVSLLTIEHQTTKYFIYGTTIIIAIFSLLNIAQEFLIAQSGAVTTDHVKYIVRLILKVVLDGYDFSNDCRASLLVLSPTDPQKLVVYDRLPVGYLNRRKSYFLKGQGVPGKAWAHAWRGAETVDLVHCIQFGNVPGNKLGNKNYLREHFREAFNIESDGIYDSLGEQKHQIKSYMSVGILDDERNLVAVLALDSVEENYFTEFETLKKAKEDPTIIEQKHGVLMVGNGNDNLPKPIHDIMQSVQNSIRKLSDSPPDEVINSTKETNFMVQALTSRQEIATFGVGGYIFPLSWALLRVKEILLKYPTGLTK